MDKSIKQIAEEIGVSKQAVFKKIKREPLSTYLQPFISMVDGRLMVSIDGEKLIKQAFDNKNIDRCKNAEINKNISVDDNEFTVVNNINDNQSSTINQSKDNKTSNQNIENMIVLLEDTIDTLKSQLEIKDAQIEKLTDALVAAQQTAAAAQALHAGTMQQQITTQTEEIPKKKSWLKNLFK